MSRMENEYSGLKKKFKPIVLDYKEEFCRDAMDCAENTSTKKNWKPIVLKYNTESTTSNSEATTNSKKKWKPLVLNYDAEFRPKEQYNDENAGVLPTFVARNDKLIKPSIFQENHSSNICYSTKKTNSEKKIYKPIKIIVPNFQYAKLPNAENSNKKINNKSAVKAESTKKVKTIIKPKNQPPSSQLKLPKAKKQLFLTSAKRKSDVTLSPISAKKIKRHLSNSSSSSNEFRAMEQLCGVSTPLSSISQQLATTTLANADESFDDIIAELEETNSKFNKLSANIMELQQQIFEAERARSECGLKQEVLVNKLKRLNGGGKTKKKQNGLLVNTLNKNLSQHKATELYNNMRRENAIETPKKEWSSLDTPSKINLLSGKLRQQCLLLMETPMIKK